MKRSITVASSVLLLLGLLAGPAAANHDHWLRNPSGCVRIPVGHQAHGENDPGLKFQGSAHVGAAVGWHTENGVGTLGHGSSPVQVEGYGNNQICP
jgi:hypothetical protein